MGAIPKAIRNMQERKRGLHQLNSFNAIGPLAEEHYTARHSSESNDNTLREY